ncbi:MAG: 6-phosphogluconolactonase [Thermomicrobiaceae bacterium]
MSAIQTEISGDADQVARGVADRLAEIAGESINRHGRCTIALAGGSTPKRLYQILATNEYRSKVDWSNVHLFLGDERYVPLDHPDSNYRMAKEALIDHVSISPNQVRSVPTELDPAECAREYESVMRNTFHAGADEIPEFDLILLGIGRDGHTASLFPGTSALQVHDRLVIENWVPQQDSIRITFTIPTLQAARTTVLMATGDDKADAVARALEGELSINETPSQVLRDSNGSVTFALDRAAAAKLAS